MGFVDYEVRYSTSLVSEEELKSVRHLENPVEAPLKDATNMSI